MSSPSETQKSADPNFAMPEATLTIHQDTRPDRVLFSVDMAMDEMTPEQIAELKTAPVVDLVMLTLFNIGRVAQIETPADQFAEITQKVFYAHYERLGAALNDIGQAAANGASPDELKAIRQHYGIEFRAE